MSIAMKKYVSIFVLTFFVAPLLIGIPMLGQWLATCGPLWMQHKSFNDAMILGPGVVASLMVAWGIVAIVGFVCFTYLIGGVS